jgi:biotin transport system substrate-specific component
MVPVPITMQTFAVTLVGAFFGWRLGALTVLAWLAEGALGMPVFASGSGGLAHILGSTGGYLFAFPFCAALTGWLAEHGWNGRRIGLAFASMLLGNLLCLALGAAWLAFFVGAGAAIAIGVTPFLIGAVLKSALAAALMKALPFGRLRRIG